MYRNKINDMKYVGQTICSFDQRLSTHLTNTIMACSYIDRALHKYGKDNFEFIILEDNIPNELMDEKEIYYIKKYDTFNNGYNLTLGGKGTLKYEDELIEKIRADLLNTKLSMYKIANKYGVGYDLIIDINYGRARHSNKLNYPIREVPSNHIFSESIMQDVIELLKNTDYSMTKIADITNTNLYYVYDINRGKRTVLNNSKLTFPIRGNKTIRVNMTVKLAIEIINELKKYDCSTHQIAVKFGVYDYTVGSINRGKHSICKLLTDYDFPIRKKPYRNKENAINAPRKITEDALVEIIDLLINTNLSFEELASRYSVKKNCIKLINEGKTFKLITNKYKLPIRQNSRINKDVQL